MLFSLLLYFFIRMLSALLIDLMLPALVAAIVAAAATWSPRVPLRFYAAGVLGVTAGIAALALIEPVLPPLIRVSQFAGVWKFIGAFGASCAGVQVVMMSRVKARHPRGS